MPGRREIWSDIRIRPLTVRSDSSTMRYPCSTLRQGFGQGAPKVGVLHRGDRIVSEPLVPRVAEEEQQTAQTEPTFRSHLQLHGGSAHRADGPHRFDPV